MIQQDEPSLATVAFRRLMRGLPEICDAAFAHAICRIQDYHPLTASDQERRAFFQLCADGHKLAQLLLIDRMCEIEEMKRQANEWRKDASRQHNDDRRRELQEAIRAIEYSEAVCRTIANGIAWTLMGGRPWVMRRYYLGERPIALSSSNLRCARRILDRVNASRDKLAFLDRPDIVHPTRRYYSR